LPSGKQLAAALALATALLGMQFGTFTAGGADSFGYVSQADLWLQRTLIIDSPLADEAPWRHAVWPLTPLGYRPGDRRGTMVPVYSPGLPLVMAAFKALAGSNAVYFVVPLCGAIAIWLTFIFGRQIGTSASGLLAAVALIASPPFLYQLMWPMSDVPVTMWWLLAIVLAMRQSTVAAGGAGLAVAMAVLTRPNLVFLALPVLAFILMSRSSWVHRLRAAGVFTLATLPGPLAVAAINRHLYESPFASGYGTFDTIYSREHLVPNLVNYGTWLVQTTPFILLAFAVPLIWRSDRSKRAVYALTIAFSAVLFGCYAFYTPYDHWNFLRFLLPAFPLLLARAAASCELLLTRARAPRYGGMAVIALLLVAWGGWAGRTAFDVKEHEARYKTAGRFATGLPDNAVILANLHSGSLRYYANRLTIRTEWLYPDVYGEALQYLQGLDRPVFAVLDEAEREPFRRRYGAHGDVSWLDREPIVVAPGGVYFYRVPYN
jgi:4-amino-4-deoxy-L-arabinose transferase-like glycosyltransferase